MVAIDRRSAPNMFIEPSGVREGPVRISSVVPTMPRSTSLPRGTSSWTASMPQWCPLPGASVARASGEPIITASAPQAMAFGRSPDQPTPPSAMTCTYRPPDSSR
ncbi:hypothetical protein WP39_18475 [Streptomyces sp. 604F]|nr:hypothetical protein [Streptomyces sp. 604F]